MKKTAWREGPPLRTLGPQGRAISPNTAKFAPIPRVDDCVLWGWETRGDKKNDIMRLVHFDWPYIMMSRVCPASKLIQFGEKASKWDVINKTFFDQY